MKPEHEEREQAFWDEHVPPLEQCLAECEEGPDPNTELVLDALEPLQGMAVLDFACGAGIMSVWLAARGASVVGLDVSPASTERATELARAMGADARFVAGELGRVPLAPAVFDRIAGRYALHHVDLTAVAPLLAARLRPGGTGAFLETMSTNPVLRLARRTLVGRFGIPRLGTLDEHPLTTRDLDLLRKEFGELRVEVRRMAFLRILDRQVLQYRSERLGRALGRVDDFLLERLRWRSGSYHQVVIVRR